MYDDIHLRPKSLRYANIASRALWPMWEFKIEKESSQQWIWTRSANGRTFQRSPATYQSFGSALNNAMLYGFDATEHKFRLHDLPQVEG